MPPSVLKLQKTREIVRRLIALPTARSRGRRWKQHTGNVACTILRRIWPLPRAPACPVRGLTGLALLGPHGPDKRLEGGGAIFSG